MIIKQYGWKLENWDRCHKIGTAHFWRETGTEGLTEVSAKVKVGKEQIKPFFFFFEGGGWKEFQALRILNAKALMQ